MTLFLFKKLKEAFSKLSCINKVTPEENNVKEIDKQANSEVYENLLLISKAIDKIRTIHKEHRTPPQWDKLITNILFYNNNYNFNKNDVQMAQYLEESLPQIKSVQNYYNQQAAPEFDNIKQAINNLITSMEKELSKHKKKLK